MKRTFHIGICVLLSTQLACGSFEDPDYGQTSQPKPRQTLVNQAIQGSHQMPKIDIINYVTGAYYGTLAGSFFVHVFDTVAAKRFMREKFEWKSFTKHTFKSYLPVCLWVVPARGISFGAYGFFQNTFSNMLFDPRLSRVLSATLSGLCLSALSVPAEVLKTRRQLGGHSKSLTFYEVKKNLVPLSLRVVPTVTCMLAGTDFIRDTLPFTNIVISTSCASLMAATLSQIFATPSENLRIYRIHHQDYATPTRRIISKLTLAGAFAGFWSRGLSLGIQAAFSLSAANAASLNNSLK